MRYYHLYHHQYYIIQINYATNTHCYSCANDAIGMSNRYDIHIIMINELTYLSNFEKCFRIP